MPPSSQARSARSRTQAANWVWNASSSSNGSPLPTSEASEWRLPDVDASHVLVLITGIALAASKPEQRTQAERLLDPAVDGMTTGPR